MEKRHSCLSAKRWKNDACKKSLANSVFRYPKNRTLVIFFVIIKIEHWWFFVIVKLEQCTISFSDLTWNGSRAHTIFESQLTDPVLCGRVCVCVWGGGGGGGGRGGRCVCICVCVPVRLFVCVLAFCCCCCCFLFVCVFCCAVVALFLFCCFVVVI